jgi:hypothetical protein
MSDTCYWMIDYKLIFHSNFHIGAGLTLMGGNLHGLRLDEDGLPYLPHTQVRGLLRLGGYRLQTWQPSLNGLFQANFAGEKRNTDVFWSYSRAAILGNLTLEHPGAKKAGLLKEQTHIRINNDGVVGNMFRYEKGGTLPSKWDGVFQGRIYAVEPATERDVAFLIAAMRTEDRVGHRRTRGYGKVNWEVRSVWKYAAGNEPEEVKKSLDDWLNILLPEVSP